MRRGRSHKPHGHGRAGQECRAPARRRSRYGARSLHNRQVLGAVRMADGTRGMCGTVDRPFGTIHRLLRTVDRFAIAVRGIGR